MYSVCRWQLAFPNNLFKVRCMLTLCNAMRKNGRWESKQVLLERVNVVCATGNKLPSSLWVLDGGSVVTICLLNEPVCRLPTVVLRCQWCRMRIPLQIPLATHCQFSWIYTRLLPLGCSWHRVIIWTACRSLGSIRYYPHSFSLSFQLPLTLSSWPCSCFGEYFLSFILYLIRVS